jgi:hypothetical protein
LRAQERLLSAGNLSAPFALSPSALKSDSDLLVALRVIAATPTELKRYADAFGGKALSDRNERKWRLLLRETVEALLVEAEEQTSAADDRALLANSTIKWRNASMHSRGPNKPAHSPGARSERRRYAALVCRLGEKLLLREILTDLDAELRALKLSAKQAATN